MRNRLLISCAIVLLASTAATLMVLLPSGAQPKRISLVNSSRLALQSESLPHRDVTRLKVQLVEKSGPLLLGAESASVSEFTQSRFKVLSVPEPPSVVGDIAEIILSHGPLGTEPGPSYEVGKVYYFLFDREKRFVDVLDAEGRSYASGNRVTTGPTSISTEWPHGTGAP